MFLLCLVLIQCWQCRWRSFGVCNVLCKYGWLWVLPWVASGTPYWVRTQQASITCPDCPYLRVGALSCSPGDHIPLVESSCKVYQVPLGLAANALRLGSPSSPWDPAPRKKKMNKDHYLELCDRPSQTPFDVDIIILTYRGRNWGINKLNNLSMATQPVSGGLDLIHSVSKSASSDPTCYLWIGLCAVCPEAEPGTRTKWLSLRKSGFLLRAWE